MKFAAAKAYILQFLENQLPKGLPYHGLHHTLDVYAATQRLAWAEQVQHADRLLLLTAALLHDAGFVRTYQDHEAAGC
ncbi:MAG: HD domain-containing protein, partial [Bacteroidota bacterium]